MHGHILILLSCHQLLHFEIEVPYKPHGSMKHHFEQLIHTHTHTVLPNTDNEKVQTATGKLKVLCEILHLIAQLLGVGHCLQSQSKVSCFRFFLSSLPAMSRPFARGVTGSSAFGTLGFFWVPGQELQNLEWQAQNHPQMEWSARTWVWGRATLASVVQNCHQVVASLPPACMHKVRRKNHLVTINCDMLVPPMVNSKIHSRRIRAETSAALL